MPKHLPFVVTHFNPRSPHGERRDAETSPLCRHSFQPTLPARGATYSDPYFDYQDHISTHAPRTGSDRMENTHSPASMISTHAPRTGSDEGDVAEIADFVISTHAPRTGSDGSGRLQAKSAFVFQPTLPARGATKRLYNCCIQRWTFQPTLPARGATEYLFRLCDALQFQPTLPARGATTERKRKRKAAKNFNPRSPHGERRRTCQS